MQIVMIYFLWSGTIIPTSKVKRENNKSWYWQRNMRQLLIFCLLLTSFPLHGICFTGYSLSEVLSNQLIQNITTYCSFCSVLENYKFSTCCEHQIVIWSAHQMVSPIFWITNLQNWMLLLTLTVHKNKQTNSVSRKKSWIRTF
jgi:hypothetical protein